MISSYELSNDTLSIKYNNIFLKQGIFYYLTTNQTSLPLVNKWKHTYSWHPVVKVFESETDILQFIESPYSTIDFALYGDILWYGNIGHALYDDLYPLYVALLRFGLDNQDFVLVAQEHLNKLTLFHEVLLRFAKYDAINLYDHPPTLIKTLVAGNGNVGSTAISKDYTIGGREYDGLRKFRNRIYESFSVNQEFTRDKIRISIIDNKRYSPQERLVLKQIVDHFSTNYSDVIIDYVDWSKFPNFEEQLKKIREIDIHVSGPGTGMMYAPFLRDGAANINLGYMEHSQTNGSRPNIYINDCVVQDFIFPGWMEQGVCNGMGNYVSTLYYDRYTHPEIEFDSLKKNVYDAIELVRTNTIQSDNLHLDAKIFVEYCKRCKNPDEVCRFLADKAFFVELLICEHPYAVNNNIIDIDLLRYIKREMNYNFKYDYPSDIKISS